MAKRIVLSLIMALACLLQAHGQGSIRFNAPGGTVLMDDYATVPTNSYVGLWYSQTLGADPSTFTFWTGSTAVLNDSGGFDKGSLNWWGSLPVTLDLQLRSWEWNQSPENWNQSPYFGASDVWTLTIPQDASVGLGSPSTIVTVQPVPEPSPFAMSCLGLALMAGRMWVGKGLA